MYCETTINMIITSNLGLPNSYYHGARMHADAHARVITHARTHAHTDVRTCAHTLMHTHQCCSANSNLRRFGNPRLTAMSNIDRASIGHRSGIDRASIGQERQRRVDEKRKEKEKDKIQRELTKKRLEEDRSATPTPPPLPLSPPAGPALTPILGISGFCPHTRRWLRCDGAHSF